MKKTVLLILAALLSVSVFAQATISNKTYENTISSPIDDDCVMTVTFTGTDDAITGCKINLEYENCKTERYEYVCTNHNAKTGALVIGNCVDYYLLEIEDGEEFETDFSSAGSGAKNRYKGNWKIQFAVDAKKGNYIKMQGGPYRDEFTLFEKI